MGVTVRTTFNAQQDIAQWVGTTGFNFMERIGTATESLAISTAPVDGGRLKNAHSHRTTRVSVDKVRTDVINSVEYAVFVHEGTGEFGPTGQPYEITTRPPDRPARSGPLSSVPGTGRLRWFQGGRPRFAKVVVHRGNRPNPWLANAMRKTLVVALRGGRP